MRSEKASGKLSGAFFLNSPGEMLDLIWTKKKAQLSKADRKLLQEMVEKHRLEIFKEWEQKVNRP